MLAHNVSGDRRVKSLACRGCSNILVKVDGLDTSCYSIEKVFLLARKAIWMLEVSSLFQF